ncbi:N-acetyl-alpha-D-glucosaminyl L-malate synthase [Acidipropionibacterium virtanenii]|uniref:N-acetyl-alpha-D-glucosaminyl L-malate synthase n=1 Tax=Acidipropionibacterium virtanenii TaxID=2057246 RepID=A0A344UXJ5_9ACTN|nr:N-acetyl-alpha-D-glucosaminyl L-malate synthase [Acidipropionibacterium virtanenii]
MLFLLTNSYPLAKGEEFIENEIDELAARFQRVIVVATQTRPGDVVTRPVPGNVEVITAGGPRPTGRAALLSALRGLVRLPRNSWSRDLLSPPRRLGLEAMFEDHARTTEAELLAELPSLRLRPDSHAVVYSYWFLDAARVAMLLADDLRARGVMVDRLVSRAHGYDLYPERSPLGHLPERRLLLETFDAVCPVSEQGRRSLVAEWPQYAAKVRTHHLGTPDPGQPAACSREPFHIVSCASLLPVKRMTRMPEILAELRGRGIDARWTHIGAGPQTAAVEEAARNAGVSGQVGLLGHVGHDEILGTERDLHPSCLINLSSSEGVPVSMMEAASLGIPIIGTDVGGVPEIITDSVNGRLIPVDFTDIQAADALQWLAELPADTYQQVCRASRLTWQSDYDQAVVGPRFCAEALGTPAGAD